MNKQNKNGHIDTENKLMATKEKVGGCMRKINKQYYI